jgi:predicted outer membrane repeat protein
VNISESSANEVIHIENVSGKAALFKNVRFDTSIGSFIAASDVIKLQLINCSFYRALVDTDGGAVWADGIRTLTVEGCIFNDNRGLTGGALYLGRIHTLVISNSTFYGNMAESSGGAIYGSRQCGSVDILDSSLFNWNTAPGHGGAIHTFCNSLRVTDTIFKDNTGDKSGGAIYSEGSLWLSFIRCYFIGNAANFGGGAIAIIPMTSSSSSSSSLSEPQSPSKHPLPSTKRSSLGSSSSHVPVYVSNVVNCTFIDNTASWRMYADPADQLGGAIFSGVPFHISGSNFYTNTAGRGGAIYFQLPGSSKVNMVNINETIFEGNSALQTGGVIFYEGMDSNPYAHAKWNLNFKNVAFQHNMAPHGAVIGIRGNIPDFDFKNTQNVTFTGNTASYGAAIFITQATRPVIIEGQTFKDQIAEVAGGIVFYGGFNITIPKNFQMNLCSINYCHNVHAKTWGNQMATLKALIRVELSQLNMETRTKNVFYPGVSRIIDLTTTDQFRQNVRDANQVLYEIEFETCHTNPLCNTFRLDVERRNVLSTDENVKLLRVTLTGDHLPYEPLEGVLIIKGTVNKLSDAPKQVEVIHIPIKIENCGASFGPSLDRPNECHTCPLGSFGFNGTCTSCISDSRVVCFGGEVKTQMSGFWVMNNSPQQQSPSSQSLDARANEFQVLHCPAGWCTGGSSVCTFGREGVLCGRCSPPLHESITSMCITCSKTNWPMIFIALLILWASSIILHSLVAVSSGKSTILIFFVQTSITVSNQVSISEAFGLQSNHSKGLPKIVQYILCFFPMDHLTRSLIIGLIPFMMIVCILLTFGIHRLVKIVRSKWAIFRIQRQSRFEDVPHRSLHIKLVRNTVSTNEELLPRPSYGYEFEDDAVEDDETMSSSEDKLLMDLVADSGAVGGSDFETIDDEIECNDPIQRVENETSKVMEEWRIRSAFFHTDRMIRTVLALYASSFTSILGVIMASVGCVELMNGMKVLQSAPSIQCDSKRLNLWRFLYILFIPYLAIVFIIILAKLIRGYLKNTLSRTDVRYGAWYEMYKPHLFGWKLTEFARRICLSLASNSLASKPIVRASVLAIILIICLTVQLLARPYNQKLENRLEAVSLISLSLISVIIIWQSRNTHASAIPATLTWSIIICITVLFVAAFSIRKLSTQVVLLKIKTYGKAFLSRLPSI